MEKQWCSVELIDNFVIRYMQNAIAVMQKAVGNVLRYFLRFPARVARITNFHRRYKIKNYARQ